MKLNGSIDMITKNVKLAELNINFETVLLNT